MAFGLVMLVQLWIVTAGWMTEWPQYSIHYNRLADALLRGQCSLLIRPAPEHLALADPYDPVANRKYRRRQGVHDAVLFNGKFYLCWGPVPALSIVPVKYVTGARIIGDQYLVFAFTAGAMLFSTMLMRRLWGRFFTDLPPWTLVVGVVVAGLSAPLAHLLARSAVYEAAIMGGQCFLLAGFYFACAACLGHARLALTGACWALAVGSRASLAPAVGALTLLLVWRIVREAWQREDRLRPSWRARFDPPRLAALGAPLLAGAALLGWYNFIRFGSWREFGQRYQLTGANYHGTPSLFAVANVWPGLYSYLLRPPYLVGWFPFLISRPGGGTFPWFIRLPEHYEYNEPIAGLLLCVPFLWLVAIPLQRLAAACVIAVRSRALPPLAAPQSAPGEASALNWTLACLFAATLGFAPVLFMLGSTMRYEADLTPCLMILATIGVWQRGRALAAKPRPRRTFFAIVGLLATYSVIVGLLLSITGYYGHFPHFNSELYHKLSYWTHPPVDLGQE